MIKFNIEKHTINWLKKQNGLGLLDFEISIQRKEVWDKEHMSNLIISLLLNVPVESLLFEEDNGEEGFKVLDGKQRSTTILKFINNEFPISENSTITEINGIDLAGKKFSDFPEDFQDDIKDYELSIAVVRPLDEEEREQLFFMRNQAVPLTKAELTKVIAGSEIANIIQSFQNHPFMSKTNLTSSALRRCEDQQVIFQCLILENNEDLSFSGKDIEQFAKKYREIGISDDNISTLLKVFDYLNTSFPEKNKNLRKTHIPMVYEIAKKAIYLNISEKKFHEWMEEFFKHIRKRAGNTYSNACSAGSTKKDNIKKRLEYMNNHFSEYFKNIHVA